MTSPISTVFTPPYTSGSSLTPKKEVMRCIELLSSSTREKQAVALLLFTKCVSTQDASSIQQIFQAVPVSLISWLFQEGEKALKYFHSSTTYFSDIGTKLNVRKQIGEEKNRKKRDTTNTTDRDKDTEGASNTPTNSNTHADTEREMQDQRVICGTIAINVMVSFCHIPSICNHTSTLSIIPFFLSFFHSLYFTPFQHFSIFSSLRVLRDDSLSLLEKLSNAKESSIILYRCGVIETLSLLCLSKEKEQKEKGVLFWESEICEGEEKTRTNATQESSFEKIVQCCQGIFYFGRELYSIENEETFPNKNIRMKVAVSNLKGRPELESEKENRFIGKAIGKLLRFFSSLLSSCRSPRIRWLSISSLSSIFLFLNSVSLFSSSQNSPSILIDSLLSPQILEEEGWYEGVMIGLISSIVGATVQGADLDEERLEGKRKQDDECMQVSEKSLSQEKFVDKSWSESERKDEGETLKKYGNGKDNIRKKEKCQGFMLVCVFFDFISPFWPLLSSPTRSYSSSPNISPTFLSSISETQFLHLILHLAYIDLRMGFSLHFHNLDDISAACNLVVSCINILISCVDENEDKKRVRNDLRKIKRIGNIEKRSTEEPDRIPSFWWEENSSFLLKIRDTLSGVMNSIVELLVHCQQCYRDEGDLHKEDEFYSLSRSEILALSSHCGNVLSSLLFHNDDISSSNKRILYSLFPFFVEVGPLDNFEFLWKCILGLKNFLINDEEACKIFVQDSGEVLLFRFVLFLMEKMNHLLNSFISFSDSYSLSSLTFILDESLGALKYILLSFPKQPLFTEVEDFQGTYDKFVLFLFESFPLDRVALLESTVDGTAEKKNEKNIMRGEDYCLLLCVCLCLFCSPSLPDHMGKLVEGPVHWSVMQLRLWCDNDELRGMDKEGNRDQESIELLLQALKRTIQEPSLSLIVKRKLFELEWQSLFHRLLRIYGSSMKKSMTNSKKKNNLSSTRREKSEQKILPSKQNGHHTLSSADQSKYSISINQTLMTINHLLSTPNPFDFMDSSNSYQFHNRGVLSSRDGFENCSNGISQQNKN